MIKKKKKIIEAGHLYTAGNGNEGQLGGILNEEDENVIFTKKPNETINFSSNNEDS